MARTKQQKPEIAPAIRFVGPRDASGRALEFYVGIPARDLTERDLQRLTPDQIKLVNKSALYAAVDEPALVEQVADDPATAKGV